MTKASAHHVRVAGLSELESKGWVTANVQGHTLVLFRQDGKVYALDNRCPHMGFPLHRGTVKDGILTCHWHSARFDLESGGTFDLFADDVRVFPVEVRDGEVWVDLRPQVDRLAHQQRRLRDGLERNISLVTAKAVIALLDAGVAPSDPFRTGLDFGVRYRQAGWGQGLTMLTCFVNLLPVLQPEEGSHALYHGLAAVARDCEGEPPRFAVQPLPSTSADLPTYKRWFRQFVQVRDAEGAERCLVSAIRAGADSRAMADMLFAAATDHRYLTIGHVLDFTNKAFEALDLAGWDMAEGVLTSLASAYAGARRMEESNAWRHPIDLVGILQGAFEGLPVVLAEGRSRGPWSGRAALVPVLLADDPQAIADGLLEALAQGARPDELAGTVAHAAALRIARFPTSNEFPDWDTALHTFTFANAVHQGLRRTGSPELVRGVFDAAISVYLDRFLNVPPARLPEPPTEPVDPEALLAELPGLLDGRQQVDEAGRLVTAYLHGGGDPARLMSLLGRLLLREDRDFHTIQTVEAAFRQHALTADSTERAHLLVAAARYLAAHAPTMRAQGQTFEIAQRLFRGERLYEEV